MSQTQTDPSQSPTPPAAPADDDPLAHLHKMSTTAGLGSGDYVAVNGTAVFALLLGLASALALMSEALLLLPLACLVVSIVALRQIGHSNGTQTGKGLAVIAFVLALGFGGFVFGRWATEGYRTREDRIAINKLISDFSTKARSDDVAAAYGLFSDRFRSRIDPKTFADRLKALKGFGGKLLSVGSNGLIEFQTDESTGDRYAWTSLKFTFEKFPFADTAKLHKQGDEWQIDDLPQTFPAPQAQGQPQPGARGQGR